MEAIRSRGLTKGVFFKDLDEGNVSKRSNAPLTIILRGFIYICRIQIYFVMLNNFRIKNDFRSSFESTDI